MYLQKLLEEIRNVVPAGVKYKNDEAKLIPDKIYSKEKRESPKNRDVMAMAGSNDRQI